MSVRAKFKVTKTSQTPHWDVRQGHLHEITLMPVTGGTKENESFFASTPCGSITLGTVNHEAAQHFKLGAEMYVDFSAAE